MVDDDDGMSLCLETLVQPRNARRFERFGTLYVELYEDPNGGALFFGIVNFDWIFDFGFGIRSRYSSVRMPYRRDPFRDEGGYVQTTIQAISTGYRKRMGNLL